MIPPQSQVLRSPTAQVYTPSLWGETGHPQVCGCDNRSHTPPGRAQATSRGCFSMGLQTVGAAQLEDRSPDQQRAALGRGLRSLTVSGSSAKESGRAAGLLAGRLNPAAAASLAGGSSESTAGGRLGGRGASSLCL